MKKVTALTALLFFALTTPAFAVSSKANVKAQTNAHTTIQTAEVVEVSTSPSPTVTDTVTPSPTVEVTATPSASPTPTTACDPNGTYKNHGAYVSCVAHTHPGGQVVAAAARSDVGKKHAEVTPSISPSVSPTVEPSGEPSTSPVTSAAQSLQTFNPLASLGDMFGRFVSFFAHLI